MVKFASAYILSTPLPRILPMPLPLTIGYNFPEHLQGSRPHPLDPPIDIYRIAGNFHIFRMCVLHAKIETTKISTIENFCMNFDLTTRGEDRIQTARVVPNL